MGEDDGRRRQSVNLDGWYICRFHVASKGCLIPHYIIDLPSVKLAARDKQDRGQTEVEIPD